MKKLLTALFLGGVGLATVAATASWPEAAPTPPAPPPVLPAGQAIDWVPPVWFPEETRDELWVLGHLDGEPLHSWGPEVMAHGGILADLDAGEVLWARDPDGLRGMASVTKLFTGLALVSRHDLDLTRETCVDYEQWPSRPGARSKFETGDCHTGWEYLGAAMVASDNRGAYALPDVAGVEYFSFLQRMEQVAHDLGAEHVEFGDPAGLEDENRASPRAVLKAVVAAAHHPTLSTVASAPTWHIEPERGDRRLYSTNRILMAHGHEYDTLAAKTGYTDTARYCFATVVRSRRTGRTYGAVILGSPHGYTRWRDVRSMLSWADTTQPDQRISTR